MLVFRIMQDTMSGVSYKGFVFLDERTAQLYSEDNKEEWVGLKVKEAEGEEISGDRCIVDGKVYVIYRTAAREYLVERGLAKLTEEEKEALGL